jgi:hypothetical protein
MISIKDALLNLIKLEQQYVGNPITCGQELIYDGYLSSTCEIIIPRVGDLIQELSIMYCNSKMLLNVVNAYIETVNDYEMTVKRWPLHIYKKITGLKLICDYEINLLIPYQVTKLVIIIDTVGNATTKDSNYIIESHTSLRSKESYDNFNLGGNSNLQIEKTKVSIIASYIFVDINARRKLIESKYS